MVEATPSTLQVKLNGSRTPAMTNPSDTIPTKNGRELVEI